jgi:ABC-type nitrate/sulfonate/bicarbonate transport system substrate-binding protein
MKKSTLKIMAVTLALLLLTACGKQTPSSAPDATKAPAESVVNVTLVLDYVPNTNHTGFYVAQKLGYFAEEGLSVNIIEPGENMVATLVATGDADFGISYQEDVTYARAAADPLPIKAIATIIQHNTSGIASAKSKNITSPKDFEGKIYAGWGAPSEEATLKAIMTADGADPNKLNIITSDGSGYEALEKNVDLEWFYWAWDGIACEIEDFPINYIALSAFDERLDYYTPVIISGEKLLSANPDTARKFLSATKRGFEYAIEHPEEAAEILQQAVPEYDIEMLKKSQQYLAAEYAKGSEWGLMKESVWDAYTAFMVEYGLIEKQIVAADCYTNEFLPK